MARAAIFPTNSEMVTPDGYRNVCGFSPGDCGKDKKIVGLMHLDGNGLQGCCKPGVMAYSSISHTLCFASSSAIRCYAPSTAS